MLLITHHVAESASTHPRYNLLGFSAALAPKFICWFDTICLDKMSVNSRARFAIVMCYILAIYKYVDKCTKMCENYHKIDYVVKCGLPVLVSRNLSGNVQECVKMMIKSMMLLNVAYR